MTPAHTSYLICSTPRTGSSLLCDALAGTGVAGRPEEYFQFRARTGFPRRPQEYFEGAGDPEIFDILGPRTRVEDVEARYDPSRFERYEQYLAWAVEAGTTSNGVFGAKVMWGYFNGFVTGLRWALPGRQRLPVPELVQSVFPNLTYITVSRRDKVRQAVSLWRALQTWSWSSDQNPARAAGDHLTYSHAAIAHLIKDIEDHESG
jgi:LPS sulfotransferase NodH